MRPLCFGVRKPCLNAGRVPRRGGGCGPLASGAQGRSGSRSGPVPSRRAHGAAFGAIWRSPRKEGLRVPPSITPRSRREADPAFSAVCLASRRGVERARRLAVVQVVEEARSRVIECGAVRRRNGPSLPKGPALGEGAPRPPPVCSRPVERVFASLATFETFCCAPSLPAPPLANIRSHSLLRSAGRGRAVRSNSI